MMLIFVNLASGEVKNGYLNNGKGFEGTYPIVKIDNSNVEKIINKKINAILAKYIEKVKLGEYKKVSLTYYTKYEDNNIVNFMFYINTTNLNNKDKLLAFTITYDKYNGEIVPKSRYLNITLDQLQDALNNSKAYVVDGLDNGVNITRKIPYVSDDYFIVTDGSVGLLYQAGDLMDIKDGATKLIISPEKIKETYELNKK